MPPREAAPTLGRGYTHLGDPALPLTLAQPSLHRAVKSAPQALEACD